MDQLDLAANINIAALCNVTRCTVYLTMEAVYSEMWAPERPGCFGEEKIFCPFRKPIHEIVGCLARSLSLSQNEMC